ncbi:MAG: RNase H family protein [Methanolinea sp.]
MEGEETARSHAPCSFPPLRIPRVPACDAPLSPAPGCRLPVMVDGSGDGHSIALFPGDEVYLSYERGASNNDAEFNAVILALENLPDRSRARIHTDSQVVVWHLSAAVPRRPATYARKKERIQDLIASKDLDVEFCWIPRRENRADRLLRNYIASLCGAGGSEPLYHRVRRLERENAILRARLMKAMKMLRARPAADPVDEHSHTLP